MKPKFEDILNLTDAEVQFALIKVKDELIAAAVYSADLAIREKLLKNVAETRRNRILAFIRERQKIPNRTTIVARRVITKILFGIKDEEVEKITEEAVSQPKTVPKISKQYYQLFIDKMQEKNPIFKRAQKLKRVMADIQYIKRKLLQQE
jgi:flagellar motor switch protein FliG